MHIGMRHAQHGYGLTIEAVSDKNEQNRHAPLLSQGSKSQTHRPPPHSKVILLNDEHTPMDFVVHLLESFFSLQRIEATRIALDVHRKGRGLCGSYPHEIAETKALQVNQYARMHHHPLLCITEKP